MKKLAIGILSLCTLSACSSIIEGTSQEIMVNTNPPGANCSLERQGISIARIDPTPGSATIKKTKYDMIIYCNKKGYQEASFFNHSGEAGATFGNIVLGGGIGWAVDSAAGADNKYESPVNITLVPAEKGASKQAPHVHHAIQAPESNDTGTKTTDSDQWPSSKK